MKVTNKLKDSNHSNVYISRDLTLTQRKALAASRAAKKKDRRDQSGEARTDRQRNTSPSHGPVSGSNTVPVGTAGNSAEGATAAASSSSESRNFQ